LIKNLYLTQERSLSRKAMEAPMAILLELNFSKEEILKTFMNEVFLAQDGQRAIHGFGLASQYFFNQPLNELKPHQYALLVGMIKGPSYYNPLKNPANAKRRRNLVLDIMAQQGIMSEREAGFAKKLPLDVQKRSKGQARQPAYLDLVRRQLADDYDLETLESQGLRIFTNFDPLVQSAAEDAVSKAFSGIDKQFGKEAKGLEAAMLVTDVNTGDVVAMVGGRKPRFAGFNRALDAKRQIGSLAKPAVYLTALEQPDDYTLATRIEDTAFEWEQPDGQIWSPRNFDGESHGNVSLLQALTRSYNQATARLGMDLGIGKVSKTLRKLGVTREIPQTPSVFLGAIELSTFDVASMYQTIASGGFKTPLRAIREVLDANGHPLKHYDMTVEQSFGHDSIHVLQYGMQSVMRAGTGRRAYWTLPQSHAVAGKTGTSNEQRDSWFAGFAGDYLAVAWMGQDDNSPTPLTGSKGALVAWTKLMHSVSREPLNFYRPDNIDYAWTDMSSGLLGDKQCEGSQYLPYIAGTEPLQQSDCARKNKRRRSWFELLFN
jgi:penicillin-binding protein 1B